MEQKVYAVLNKDISSKDEEGQLSEWIFEHKAFEGSHSICGVFSTKKEATDFIKSWKTPEMNTRIVACTLSWEIKDSWIIKEPKKVK